MVKIRLQKVGRVHYPQFRMVVIDSRKARDGKVIENIGKYNSNLNPSLIEIDSDRVQYWLKQGAQPSEAVKRQLELTGDWDKFLGKGGVNRVKKQIKKSNVSEKIKEIDELTKESIANAKKVKVEKQKADANENKDEKVEESSSESSANEAVNTAEAKTENKEETTDNVEKTDAPENVEQKEEPEKTEEKADETNAPGDVEQKENSENK